MYKLSSQACIGVVKQLSDSSVAWTTAYSGMPAVKSLAVDSSDQYIYVGKYENPFVVIQLNTIDGSFASAQSMVIYGSIHGITIHPLDNSSGYIVTSYEPNSGNPYICRFTGGSSANCQGISILNQYAYGNLKISDSQYFMIGSQPSLYHLHFLKITFGNTNIDWDNKMLCLGGTCAMGVSESFISNDGNNLYCFACYGSPKYLYFVTFNLTSGNVLGTRYRSNATCVNSWSSLQTGDYIVVTVYFASPTLILFNTAISQFIYKQFASSFIYQLITETNVGRVILSGTFSNSGYITKFFLQSIQAHLDFSDSTVVMSALTSGTDDIAAESGITITLGTPIVVTGISYSPISTSYSVNSDVNSNVYFQTSDVLQNYIEDYSTVLALDLSCSSTGSTVITYSISNYGPSTAPSWVTIDHSTGQLSISTPNVTADTIFSFYVNSNITGVTNPVQKLVKLTVLDCAVANCLKCLGQGNTTCQTCSSGYNLTSGTCIIQTSISSNTTSNSSSTTSSTSNSTEPSTTSKSVGTAMQAMNGATAGVVIVSSTLNMSSLSSLWCVFNQMQIFLLLILSGVYLPIDVKNIITGLKFAMSPLDYIQFNKIKIYSFAFSVFDFTLSNITLDSIGIQSDSSIFNNLSILFAILHMIPIHLLIICFRSVTKRFSPTKKCSFTFILKWLIEKCFIIMTFGYYIRVFMEMNQLMLISSIYEINKFNTTDRLRIVSLAVAFIVCIICISIVCFAIYLALSFNPSEDSKHSKFKEFFSGIKECRSSRCYIIALLFRRIIFVSVLICLISMSTVQTIIASLSIVQLVYVSYLIILRPYNNVKSNLIDIINELFFTCCICWLVYFDSKSKWNSLSISIFIWIVSSNSLIIFAVVIVDAIQIVVIKCRKKCSNNNQSSLTGNNRVAPRLDQSKILNIPPTSQQSSNKTTKLPPHANNLREESKTSFSEDVSEMHIYRVKNWE